MARSLGRGRGQVSDRGVRRGTSDADDLGVGRGSCEVGGQGVGRGFGRGSGEADGRGVSRGFGRGCGETGGRGVARGFGRGSGEASDRGVGQGNGEVRDQGIRRGSGEAGDRGVRRGSGGYSDRGLGRGSGLGSCDTIGLQSDAHHDTLMQSPIEGSDGDDESTFHVASVGRGLASQLPIPDTMNRDWIWIEEGEFSDQKACTRIIGQILKALWSGPWESWRDVSTEDKTRLFERFKWEDDLNGQVYRYFEKCIASKFPDLLGRVRSHAKAMARKQGFEVEDDMYVIIDFKPQWIRTEIWEKMIDTWNTPEWIAKSRRNSNIRSKSTGGKHTLGSQSYVTAKRKAAKIMGRELSHLEMWKQSHCMKGSRPLDKELSCSSSQVEDIDSDGVALERNNQEEDVVWVDERSRETWVKYEECLVNKYGKDQNKHPKQVDEKLWLQASGGKNKGKVYGLTNLSDRYIHERQESEMERLNKVIKELVKEKEEEKGRLNGIIEELATEKETLLNRMTNIEELVRTMAQRGQSSS